MRIATGARLLEKPSGDRTKARRGPAPLIFLACAILVAFAAFAQQPPAKVSTIRPTEPMPSVTVP